MTAMRGWWMRTGAVLIVGLGIFSVAEGAAAQTQTIDSRDLLIRLQRMERDIRDLQATTFRGSPPQRQAAAPGTDAALNPPPEAAPQQPAIPDLNPLMRRVDEIQESLGRLTGQMEELGHQVDLLSQKTDRLQKQMDYQASQASAGAVSPPVTAGTPPSPDNAGSAVASIAPPDQSAPVVRPSGAPPSNLGQIQAGAPLPVPAARPSDPKSEFDSAMSLLSRAQYDQASDAFRKFADNHPDEDRASDALYWTGDIAYSTKKDYPEAARDFAELLKKYPKAQRAPEGMLKLGLALFELGQTKEGCAALVALPAKYPDAAPSVAARARTERANNKCR